MAENKKKVDTTASSKKSKKATGKPNFIIRAFQKVVKFCKDVVGEMKKVVWTSKKELFKSTKIVLVTVVVVAAAIAIVDTVFSNGINFFAGLIG
jgi:preprotein translocase subunit SecE